MPELAVTGQSQVPGTPGFSALSAETKRVARHQFGGDASPDIDCLQARSCVDRDTVGPMRICARAGYSVNAAINEHRIWTIRPSTVMATHVALRYLPCAEQVAFWQLSTVGGWGPPRKV